MTLAQFIYRWAVNRQQMVAMALEASVRIQSIDRHTSYHFRDGSCMSIPHDAIEPVQITP